MDTVIDEVVKYINTKATDAEAIRILDSVPSNLLHLVFDKDRLKKYKPLYYDILKHKKFNDVYDIVDEINMPRITVSEELMRLLKLDKRANDLDTVLLSMDAYVESKGLSDSYDDAMYKIFKDEIDRLNYAKSLDRFRRAVLISSEII